MSDIRKSDVKVMEKTIKKLMQLCMNYLPVSVSFIKSGVPNGYPVAVMQSFEKLSEDIDILMKAVLKVHQETSTESEGEL